MVSQGRRSSSDGEREITVVCSPSPQHFEFGVFTLLYCRERQRYVTECACAAIGLLILKTYCVVSFSPGGGRGTPDFK